MQVDLVLIAAFIEAVGAFVKSYFVLDSRGSMGTKSLERPRRTGIVAIRGLIEKAREEEESVVIMDQIGSLRREPIFRRIPYRVWRRALILLIAALAALLIAILLANVQRPTVILILVFSLAASVAAFGFAVTWTARQLHREQRITTNALEASEEEFRQMAGNIQEIFWMIDAKNKKALYINEAYEAITGRSCQSLIGSSLFLYRRDPSRRSRACIREA